MVAPCCNTVRCSLRTRSATYESSTKTITEYCFDSFRCDCLASRVRRHLHFSRFLRQRVAMRQGSVPGTFSVLLCLVSIVLSLNGNWAQTTTATFPPSQLPTRGLWVQIEERGWPNGYWPGQV